MKIRLAVSKEKREEIARFLASHGIDLDENAEYVLTEAKSGADRIPVRRAKSGEKELLREEDVICLESFGHEVILHTAQGHFVSGEPLYRLERRLDPERFVRISASVIVAHVHITGIRPTLSRKYVLTLSDGTVVDVTRSYYTLFRDRFGL